MNGPPRRVSSSSSAAIGAQRLVGKHRVLFSPPDLLRWYLHGPLTTDDARALDAFDQAFSSTALLIELGENAVIDTAVRLWWTQSLKGLAVDRPTVVYGGTSAVRANLGLVLTSIDGALSGERHFEVVLAESEKEALMELTILRTRRARDSIVPR